MKKFGIFAMALMFVFMSLASTSGLEERINLNFVSTIAQPFPRVRPSSGMNPIISLSSVIYTSPEIAEATFGFMQRKIYPVEEPDFSPVGFTKSQQIFMPAPLHDFWWRTAIATVEYRADAGGIYEFYCWEEFTDVENKTKRYIGKPERMAYVADSQSATAVCKDLRVHINQVDVWLRADVAVAGLSDESYDDKNLLKGQYLYFDIYDQDGALQISRNAGRIGFGWKWRDIRIPRYEFEEKNLIEKNLLVKIHAAPAKEDIQIPMYGFQSQEIILIKSTK